MSTKRVRPSGCSGDETVRATATGEFMSESGLHFIDPPEPNERILAVEIVGHITTDDMRAYKERLDAIVALGEKALLFQDMIDYDGVDAGAVLEKWKHMGDYWRGFEKMAVVGDRRWLEIYIGIIDPITPQEIRYFDVGQRSEAFEWLVV
jgi:hypothetical protein